MLVGPCYIRYLNIKCIKRRFKGKGKAGELLLKIARAKEISREIKQHS